MKVCFPGPQNAAFFSFTVKTSNKWGIYELLGIDILKWMLLNRKSYCTSHPAKKASLT